MWRHRCRMSIYYVVIRVTCGVRMHVAIAVRRCPTVDAPAPLPLPLQCVPCVSIGQSVHDAMWLCLAWSAERDCTELFSEFVGLQTRGPYAPIERAHWPKAIGVRAFHPGPDLPFWGPCHSVVGVLKLVPVQPTLQLVGLSSMTYLYYITARLGPWTSKYMCVSS